MMRFERSRTKHPSERNHINCGRAVWQPEKNSELRASPQQYREYKLLVDSIFHPKKGSENNRWAKNIYESLSSLEKENLICAVANQILGAHPDFVQVCFQYLHNISVELRQKTEVEFQRLRFGVITPQISLFYNNPMFSDESHFV